ncbi:MAG: flippase-like domain-containing protein [Kiritimatiellae bacterium]|nr:flippase-like domain-containing protein [Kiritimatiellia bacterium]
MDKQKITFAIKLLISVGLVAFLYSKINLGDVVSLVANIDGVFLLILFGILFFNTVISTLKWKILLLADDIHLPFKNLLSSYMIASFFNIFMPSNIGGDSYRIVDIAKQSSKPVHTFASVFIDRLSGFFALSIMGFVFPLVGRGLLEDSKVLFVPFGIFLIIVIMIWSLYNQKLLRWGLRITRIDRIKKVSSMIDQFLDSVTAYKEKKGVIPKIMGVSFVFQFTVILFVYLLSTTIGYNIPLIYFCMFVPLISLLEAIPASIYGIGFRDAGYVIFFTQVGRTREDGCTMAFLYVAVTLLYALIGGVMFVVKKKRDS